MNNNSQEFITLGADVGGKDAFNATNQHILELRTLLRQECQGSYCDILYKIALVLRVDGSVQSWERNDIANISIYKKRALATADIFVPVYEWANKNKSEFRRFLMSQVVEAIKLVVAKVSLDGISLNWGELQLDLNNVNRRFLEE